MEPRTRRRAKLNRQAVRNLFEVVAKIKKPAQVEQFFQDLMSSTEIREIARRLFCAKLLLKGKTYQEIEDDLGMSPITINKIHFKTKGSKIRRFMI